MSQPNNQLQDSLVADIIRRHTWSPTAIGPGKCVCGERVDRRDHPVHVAATIRGFLASK